MTNKTVKLIAFIFLLVHGIGHLQGVVASLGIKINDSNARISWALKSMGENINSKICFVLFLLTSISGILCSLSFKGIILPTSSWQLMAIVTAILSTFCLVLFPNGFAMFFNKIGAIAVNLFVFYSIILNYQFPSNLFQD